MKLCIYCNQPIVPEERPADYCMDKACVVKGLHDRQANLRLVLMPKQGFTYVFKDSEDMKHGKSSGR